ncbi:MAG: hypothetical protein WAK20_05835 [Candidatus Acidiferrum sp.]
MLSSFTLASVILSSFFSAVSALPFAFASLIHEFHEGDQQSELNLPQAKFWYKACTLVCGSLLCAFWTVPVIQEYPYFVTRPLRVARLDMIPPGPWLWIWYAAAFGGATLMLLKGPERARTFIAGTLGLLLLMSAPFSRIHWIPSQPPRILSTFTFLLAVPVGWLMATVVRSLLQVSERSNPQRNSWLIGVLVVIGALTMVLLKPGRVDYAVYSRNPSIESVLDFARSHREGRYLVENAWQHGDQYDSRALNSYLGMQGNETLNVVFHEASPSSVFFSPLVGALSASVNSFGVSSALSSDLDFYNQSPEQHIKMARQVGVHYFACLTPWIKRRFRQQAELVEHDLGRWSVFEMKAQAVPEVEILRYLPALVVSPLNLKARQSGSYDFVRLSEEQFNGGYSDVLLVRAETNKIDELSNLEGFSALILDTYDCSDEGAAIELLRRFAQERLLVLISSDQPLYAHLASQLSELPHVLRIHRESEKQSEWLDRGLPWLELDQSNLRKEWKLIDEAIQSEKISSSFDNTEASMSRSDANLHVQFPNTKGVKAPVVIRMTFHPDWARTDGQRIYPITPFFMLTFANNSFEVIFRRTGIERTAAVLSSGVFFVLILTMITPNRAFRRPTASATQSGTGV